MIKNKKNMNKSRKLESLKRICLIILFAIVVFVSQTNNVFATDDPLAVINNLQNFIAGIIQTAGAIILILGVFQIGMSLKSHDASQRANGIMTLVGGVVIAFAPQIVKIITSG